jgi:hypothetical protein
MNGDGARPTDPSTTAAAALAAVPPRVDARDVLDPNASVSHAFDARPIGCFRRRGPNAWDDYELAPVTGETVRVLPGIEIQLETAGAAFRMRRAGEVVVLEWIPSAEERAQCGNATSTRQRFFDTYLKGYASPPGYGLAAVISKKLNEGE